MASIPLPLFCPLNQPILDRRWPQLTNRRHPLFRTYSISASSLRRQVLHRSYASSSLVTSAYITGLASDAIIGSGDPKMDESESGAEMTGVQPSCEISLGLLWSLLAQHKLRVAVSIISLIGCTTCTLSMPLFSACVGGCEKTGCVGELCFQHCTFSTDGNFSDDSWYQQEPLYIQWKKWDCLSTCRYHCMLVREEEREKLGDKPVKYHGKWPLRRGFGIQEPVSVTLCALSLAVQFHGWVSFFILVNYNLPLRPNKQTYYDYTGLWHIFGILSMNSFIWSAVSRTRDVELTEKLDISSAVAALGFSLIVALLRAFSVREQASRVMVSAPLITFVTTHILYLNFYQLDYSLNMKVCGAMGVAQLLLWAIWAGVTKHPSRWKVWVFVVGAIIATLVEIYDFPPYQGLVEAHAVWHAISIPLSYLLWSFVRDDSEYRTSALIKKSK